MKDSKATPEEIRAFLDRLWLLEKESQQEHKRNKVLAILAIPFIIWSLITTLTVYFE